MAKLEQKFGSALFPHWNKLNTLKEYQEHLFYGSSKNKVEIIKDIEVSEKEYDKIINDLLEDNPIWEEIGGRYSDEMGGHIVMVTRISVATPYPMSRPPFVVNTEGYTYARYVGFMLDDLIRSY